jgi:hypothetical protein
VLNLIYFDNELLAMLYFQPILRLVAQVRASSSCFSLLCGSGGDDLETEDEAERDSDGLLQQESSLTLL